MLAKLDDKRRARIVRHLKDQMSMLAELGEFWAQQAPPEAEPAKKSVARGRLRPTGTQ